ncbi:ImcF-related family protein [Pseudomonas sp. NPDC008258]|uniref:ImcF-related family protein n=1 Tax=Pseudomonas sp. NPDC008258 TaxID=3364418 RepID=UPI0036F0F4BF
MQSKQTVTGWVVFSILLVLSALLVFWGWQQPEVSGEAVGQARGIDTWLVVAGSAAGVLALAIIYLLCARQLARRAYAHRSGGERLHSTAAIPIDGAVQQDSLLQDIASCMREHHGLLWRRKVQVLILLGDAALVDVLAPGLSNKRWLVGQRELVLWGGSAQMAIGRELVNRWSKLFRWRAPDAVVWVMNKAQRDDAVVMNQGARRLRDLAMELRWQLPLHVWQVCSSAWPQDSREVQPVGCLLPPKVNAAQLEARLQELVQPLREAGLAQMMGDRGHDFLLRLSRELELDREGVSALAAVWSARTVSLRGLWFSLPTPLMDRPGLDHHWLATPVWDGVLGMKPGNPNRLGWSLPRLTHAALLGFAALWCAGLLLSFITNRAETQRIDQALAALQQPHEGTDPLATLRDLSLDISRLDYRAEHGAPWYYRFGLDRTRALRDAAWPHYVQAVQQQVRDPAAASLQAQLSALVKLPPGSAERAQRTQQAYTQLKAYLMLARPEKSDADFLVQTLGKNEPGLWSFYAERLPANPGWAIAADARLIAQVRQILLTQLGQRNAETSLYQQALDTAANHYPALALQQMVGDTDASPLFATTASVPGAFTRQAWEGQVREAIETAAKARREEIDWVLSDNPSDITRALSPEQLRERLTARYFNDYGKAWLAFLNSLRWRKGATLDEAISQLTLMSDNRQSPLIALMNTLAYQGQAGIRGQALADTLIQSAQNLIGQDRTAVSGQPLATEFGPLDGTFGPLLGLLGKRANGQPGDSSLSLQAFLTQVTSVRLKLQQIADAPDPQAMTQALAQSVFQGKRVDLVETRSYGSLIAASLGAEWGRAAQTLFVQPLDQAWQRVLQPSAAGLNRDWQRAIVDDWDNAFAGRYPFAVTSSDASLPMLGKLIRADTGRIERFLHQQLNGLLRKEGRRWVADPRNSQGLRFNPAFLSAVNQLGELADVLFTEGDMAVNFELRGKPVRDVVQTTFILNGEKHHYYNQRERWQRFTWPGQSNGPGVSLTWTSVFDGERLFAYNQGTWGLIRLLEQAQLTPMDAADSQYKLQLKAPDGLNLTWDLRTEFGAGPLALLKLRDFTLPQQIFIVGSD